MYIQPITDRVPQGGAGPGLGGLGFWEALIPLAIAEINKPSGGNGPAGSAGMAPAGGMVQAQISSNVSPQISPSFVQQWQPSGSPVNTSAVQNTPATGTIPGFDYGAPAGAGGYLYPSQVQSGGNFMGLTYTQWALIAGAVILAAVAYKHRAKINTHARAFGSRARRAVKAF